jgi:CubicO group peptidase (beta-lactamase class C family)
LPALPPPESVGLDTSKLQQLNAAFAQEIAQAKLPGAVITVSRHGQMVWQHSLGRLQPGSPEPMPLDAIFRIYSMTKPVVSVAAMMLVEQGKMQLDQSVADFLPSWAHLQVLVCPLPNPLPQVGEGASCGLTSPSSEGEGSLVPLARPITIRDLLCHTAGLTYDFTGRSPVHKQYMAARLFNRRHTNAEFVEVLAQLPLLHQPGTAWSYSHATDVLGRIIEVISMQSLGEFLHRQIFAPLGMQDTAFHVPPDQHHRIAQPFETDPDRGTKTLVFNVHAPAAQQMGGAGLVCTAPDYARFLDMLLCRGPAQLLQPSTINLMLTDHLKNRPVDGGFLEPGHGFGLGFAMRLAPLPHPGMSFWGGLAGTFFLIDPAQGLHAQLMVQQPGRRERYQAMLTELVYAAVR